MFNNGRTKLYNTLNPGGGQGYNAIGRISGQSYSKPKQESGNWFENAIRGFGDNIKHRAEAAGNAWGTTAAALKESGGNLFAPAFSTLFGTDYTSNESRKQNEETQNVEEENKRRLTEFANKYGYSEVNDIYDALDNAKANNDTAKLAEINNKIMPELQALTAENSKRIKNVTDSHKDYRENNFVSKQINQDPGKFLGDAITTESTMVDIASLGTGLPMGVAANAIQGGAEGIANELSENGFENFDLGRAAQNAAIGTVSGAATAGINRGLNARMLKNGGTVLKPGGAIKNTLNKAINSSVGRGMISGAVGGGVGAGTASALSGQDIQTGIQNTLSGATQGSVSGGVSGGIMGAANKIGTKAINAIDNRFGTNIGDISKIGQKWTESGDTFNERLTNTLNSGDSGIGNWLNKSSESGVLGRLGNLGNSVRNMNNNKVEKVTSKQIGDAIEEDGSAFAPKDAVKRYLQREKKFVLDNKDYFYDETQPELYDAMTKAYDDQITLLNGLDEDYVYIENNPMSENEIHILPRSELANDKAFSGVKVLGDQNDSPTTLSGWAKKAGKRIVEDVNKTNLGNRIETTGQPDAWDRLAQENGYNSYDEVIQRYMEANPNTPLNPRGAAGQILTWLDKNPNTPTTAGGWLKKAGQRLVEDVNNSNLGNRIKAVSDEYPDDIKNMKINDYNAYADGQPDAGTEVITPAQKMRKTSSKRIPVVEAEIVEDATQKVRNPETEMYNTLTKKSTLDDLDSSFEPDMSKSVQKRNKLQALGKQLQQSAKTQKYAALFDALDEKVADRAIETDAPTRLSELGIEPENYGELAKTSDYVNGVLSKVAKNSKLMVNEPDLPTMLRADNLDVSMSDDAVKTYNKYINQIVPDGPSPSEYSASELLEKSRWLGKKAEKITGKDSADIKAALREAKRITRNVAGDAMSKAGLTGPETDAKIANGLAKLGYDKKVQDYYTASVDGKSPSVTELISRTSLAEQARDMSNNMGKSRYRRSASTAPMGVGRMILRESGLEEPMKTVLRSTISPIAGQATNLAGKIIEGAGNIGAKVGGNTTPTTATSTPQTQVWDMFNRNNTANIIGRNLGERIGNEQAEKTAEEGYVQPLAATTAVDNTLESLSVPNSAVMSSAPMYDTAYAAPMVEQVQQTGNSYVQPTGDYWTDVIGRALSRAIDENNVEAFSTLYEMYQDSLGNLSKNTASGSSDTSQLNASQQAQLAKFDAADSAIDELETLFNNAGGGKGPIFGNLQSIGGNIGLDSGAKTYNDMAEGLVNQISAAIGKTDSLNTEGEVKRALKLIPQLTDDATTARNKLEELRRMLQTTKASYNSAYGIAY